MTETQTVKEEESKKEERNRNTVKKIAWIVAWDASSM